MPHPKITTFSQIQLLRALLEHEDMFVEEIRKFVDVFNINHIFMTLRTIHGFEEILVQKMVKDERNINFVKYSILPEKRDEVKELLNNAQLRPKEKKKFFMSVEARLEKKRKKPIPYELMELFDSNEVKYIGWNEANEWLVRRPNSNKTLRLPMKAIVRWSHCNMIDKERRS